MINLQNCFSPQSCCHCYPDLHKVFNVSRVRLLRKFQPEKNLSMQDVILKVMSPPYQSLGSLLVRHQLNLMGVAQTEGQHNQQCTLSLNRKETASQENSTISNNINDNNINVNDNINKRAMRKERLAPQPTSGGWTFPLTIAWGVATQSHPCSSNPADL